MAELTSPQFFPIPGTGYSYSIPGPTAAEKAFGTLANFLNAYAQGQEKKEAQLGALLPYFIQKGQVTMAPEGAYRYAGQRFNIGEVPMDWSNVRDMLETQRLASGQELPGAVANRNVRLLEIFTTTPIGTELTKRMITERNPQKKLQYQQDFMNGFANFISQYNMSSFLSGVNSVPGLPQQAQEEVVRYQGNGQYFEIPVSDQEAIAEAEAKGYRKIR
jgi:hypothetical protein